MDTKIFEKALETAVQQMIGDNQGGGPVNKVLGSLTGNVTPEHAQIMERALKHSPYWSVIASTAYKHYAAHAGSIDFPAWLTSAKACHNLMLGINETEMERSALGLR